MRLLFDTDDHPATPLCKCCRKRAAEPFDIRCQKCIGWQPATNVARGPAPICTHCNQKPARRIKGYRWGKLCVECYGDQDGSAYKHAISKDWIRKIEATVSGLRQRAKYNGEDRWCGRKQLAAAIIAQGFRCALSGELLKPDRETVLGHRVAVANGGASTVDNVFWITREMNRMMGTLDEAEFRRLCDVVAKAGTGCPGVKGTTSTPFPGSA